MQGWTITVAVIGFVLLDMAVVFGLVLPAIVRASWGAIADRHPPMEPSPDAVGREFQSFKFGLLNLGWSVHVEVDDRHLHLRPALFARLMRCRAMSIPWEEIRLQGRARARMRRAMIGRTLVCGPAWCMDLAGGGPAGPT